MNISLVKTLFTELKKMPIIDSHTHVRVAQPVAQHLGDLLGYHYYTELSNSSRGKPVPLPDDPDARIDYVWPHLPDLRGTVQFDWMMGISEIFFDIPRDDWFSRSKQEIVNRAQKAIQNRDYEQKVWSLSNIKQVTLTNQFDEDLSTLKDTRLVPALRTDDLAFNADRADSIKRLDQTFGVRSGKDLASWRAALAKVFDRFRGWKFGYAAIGLPPSFTVEEIPDQTAASLLKKLAEGQTLDDDARRVWGSFVVEELAKQCRRVNAPFCLMTGADRGVYQQGVPAGQDLIRCDAHLRGYDRLFNKYDDVRFPVLVVNDTAGLELVVEGWIRHNVYPMSHWWYCNNPVDIRRELRRRLDVLPRTKFIGFHSDVYSLEFALPKFNTYRLQLAIVLAERIEEGEVGGHTVIEPLTMASALALAERILLTNCGIILGCR
ncbi:MAG: glucuronate isomerase [Planctomycetota bacterium]